ncbi:hypothetical protein RHGRI_020300 [Rhododendron griersonianum]|uniref:Cystatin domain-containing protein n=1 Tax=Rhododendron griersonianum TaxID=479676 RepID=A0AAV6JFP7_9ERIC|nr:hypothetical protein RHGRI_020300 [Rhododendron griersonianum]
MTRSEFLELQKQRQGNGKPQQRRRQKKKKIKKKMLKPVRVNTLTGRDRYVRDFTPKEREVYNKRVRESKGFDVGEIPNEVILNPVIREIPLDPRCSIIVYSTTLANTALRDYNKDNAEQNGITRNFQARVREFLGMHIEFCREEKKPNLTEVISLSFLSKQYEDDIMRLVINQRYLVVYSTTVVSHETIIFCNISAKEFADRRMTRSEFLELQKQRQGDGKPRQRRRQKKKKIKKKMLKPARVNTLTGRDRYVRDFTPEEREVYNKRVRESKGFDVGEIPDEVILSPVIREIPLDPRCSIIVYSTTSANTALRDYNKDNHTKYQFVKLVRVCYRLAMGNMYYITFQAEQNGITRNFQARVREFLGMHIEFCREEKKPNLTEEYAMGLNRSRTRNGAFRLDGGVLGNQLVQGRHLSSREMLRLVLFLLWLGKYL